MPKAKYPLDGLRRLREEQVGLAARALGAAVRAREAASDAILAAEAARDEHRRAVTRIEDAEREALARGELRAADVARTAAWSAAARIAAQSLAAEVAQTRVDETRAQDAERAARAVATGRAAAERAVLNHRDRWRAREQRASDRSDDEAAIEAWRPKP